MLYAAVWLILIGLAWTLVPRPDEPVPGPVPRQGGTLRLSSLPLATLDPVGITSAQEACIVNQIHEGLVEFDVSLNIMPGLAERWEITRDFRHFVFHLRQDLRFHSGRRLTSADVVASLQRLARSDAVEPTIGHATLQSITGMDRFLAGQSALIDGLRASTPRTIEITLDRPAPDLLSILATEPWKISGPGGDGAGPFRLVEQSEERIVLIRFEAYHGSPAFLDSISIRIDPYWEFETELALFDRGEIDLIELPGGYEDRIGQRDDVRIHLRKGMTLEYIGFDLGHPAVADPAVRRRLAEAIDWDDYFTAGDPVFQRATSLIPPGMAGYREHPDLFRPTRGEGGDRISPLPSDLDFIVAGAPGEVNEQDRKIMAAWAAMGVQIRYIPLPWEEFDARIEAGTAPVFTMAWMADIPSAPQFLYDLFHREGWGNFGAYRNEEVDRLLERALTAIDSDERLQLVGQAEEIILRDVPIIPLDFVASIHVTRAGLEGVALSPLGTGNMQCERFWWER